MNVFIQNSPTNNAALVAAAPPPSVAPAVLWQPYAFGGSESGLTLQPGGPRVTAARAARCVRIILQCAPVAVAPGKRGHEGASGGGEGALVSASRHCVYALTYHCSGRV
ncbi:hypothetical protein EVAR_59811_1 [Eumeta japonica]|uniref:Uncharacterized protein n=1 Tax=Eumeta variegata TaxID=151549 RepID=A0A4C1YGN0_EUMVA|nr:hypothetical protein EVAR_59811_1 [Eumeta japonica]